VEIGVRHRAEKEHWQRHPHREFGNGVADRRFQVARNTGDITERRKPEDEQDRFDERRHGCR
jgi:hypothetical protein